jgi:hypothetical protein
MRNARRRATESRSRMNGEKEEGIKDPAVAKEKDA